MSAHKFRLNEMRDGPEIETVFVPLNKLVVEFVTNLGEELVEGAIPMSPDFKVSGPGIDPERVARVKFPELKYAKGGPLMAEVDMYVWDEKKEGEGDGRVPM